MVLLQGTKWAILDRRHMNTAIESNPLDRGRSVMKSTPTEYQGRGGMGRGTNLPAGGDHECLARAHLSHDLT